jgi:hypothetical protein
MRHLETKQHEAQPGAGHFFCLAIGRLPLTLPSPQRGEGEMPA